MTERDQRPRDGVAEEHEQASDHQRGGRIHVGLQLPLRREASFHSPQEPRDDHGLEDEERDRDPVELVVVAEVGHDGRDPREHGGLPREGADVGGHTPAPQQDEPKDQHQARAHDSELGKESVHGLSEEE